MYSKQKDKFLQNLIPIKTHGEWNFAIDQPGHLQVDLVSHDGGNLRGDFIQTLNIVDYIKLQNILLEDDKIKKELIKKLSKK